MATKYSEVIKVCEDVWQSIRAQYPDVPDAIILVASGGRKANSLLGHFAKNSWTIDDTDIHEVLLCAENLQRPAVEVFTTLLHEAAHSIAHTRGIKDVSGQRHNKRFSAICREIGLTPPEKPDTKLGFSAATMPLETADEWHFQIEALDSVLSLYRKKAGDKAKPAKTSWCAECNCGRKIRVGKKTVESAISPDEGLINIDCTLCGSVFILKLEDDE